jgi:peptidylprolyl isomerase
MAARRPSSPTPTLAVESLEQRRVMAASVAVGAEIGPASQPWLKLLDADTGAVKAQVLAFESGFKGGVRPAMGDVDGDGTAEVLAASGAGRVGEIRVFKVQASGGSTVLTELTAYRTTPFGSGYTGGVEIACGDVDGNGREDIVAAMSRGAGTVNVFRSVAAVDPVENSPYRTLTPFASTFNGGASVAVADLGTFSGGKLVDGTAPDNKVEILVGSGAGMPATVKAYDVSATPRVIGAIAAFPATVQGGVSVTSGRVNADAIDDIVVSAGRGGGGVTKVYEGQAAAAGRSTQLIQFAAFAGLAKPNAPAFSAAVDSDGDGQVDRYLVTQGDAGGTAGISKASTAGVRAATFTTVTGPLRIASARSFFREVTTGSGLQYRDIVVGTGAAPKVGKLVQVHYTGTLTDGRVFDSSRGRNPFVFRLGVGEVIQGWDEAIATMKVGGRRILTIPANLAYGNNPPPGSIIPKGATLVFDVEVLAAQS